jgi:hypothetical protein
LNQPEPSPHKDLVWVPLGFSAAYFVASCALGFYAGSGTWPGLSAAIGVFSALFWIALPSLLFLWLCWAWWSRSESRPPAAVLLVAGLVIPFAVAGIEWSLFTANAAFEKRKVGLQLANAHLSEVTDEVLLAADGQPIGVRLRYTVRFDEGLDNVRYRPLVSLRFESPLVAMWHLRSETDPIVADRFGKGTYRFTEDFIPMYFPGFMRFPDAPQRADDRCFYWGRPAEREIVKDAATMPATIDVSFARGPDQPMSRRSVSSRAYAQSVFYRGAQSEGAHECP